MAEKDKGRTAVLSRLRGRYDRMRELLEAREQAARQAAAEPPPKGVVSGCAIGLEAVLRAEYRVVPRPASTRALRRAHA